MAKKGQKFEKYTAELKAKILQKYLEGKGSYASLAKEYGISENTISNWAYKYRQGIDISVDHRKESGGRPKGSEIDYKERYEILKKFQAFVEAQRKRK